jgi:hypothetical protein
VPDQPVAVLRKGLQLAQRVYEQAAVGDDQLKDLRQAEAKAGEARLVWEQEAPDVREAARHLLSSTDGADVASRAAAATLAGSRLLSAEQVLRAASEEHTACKVRLEQLSKPPVALDLSRQPRDIPHGDQLTAEAAEAAEQAAALAQKRFADLDQARDHLAAAKVLADSFKTIAETHNAAADDQPSAHIADVEPFGGDVEAARERYAELRRTVARVHKIAQDAQRLLNSRAEQLELCAADGRFETLVIPIRVQIRGVPSSTLGDHAEEWMKQLRPRLRSLTDDLEQIDRHRNAILERLTAIVDGALLRLRTAQRLSKLPAGLGSWTGKEFLRISGKPVEGDLLAHQLGQVLDGAVERYKSAQRRHHIRGGHVVRVFLAGQASVEQLTDQHVLADIHDLPPVCQESPRRFAAATPRRCGAGSARDRHPRGRAHPARSTPGRCRQHFARPAAVRTSTARAAPDPDPGPGAAAAVPSPRASDSDVDRHRRADIRTVVAHPNSGPAPAPACASPPAPGAATGGPPAATARPAP